MIFSLRRQPAEDYNAKDEFVVAADASPSLTESKIVRVDGYAINFGGRAANDWTSDMQKCLSREVLTPEIRFRNVECFGRLRQELIKL